MRLSIGRVRFMNMPGIALRFIHGTAQRQRLDRGPQRPGKREKDKAKAENERGTGEIKKRFRTKFVNRI